MISGPKYCPGIYEGGFQNMYTFAILILLHKYQHSNLFLFFEGQSCFMVDTLYKGNDILGDCDLQPENWKTETPQECQILCQDLEECTDFTWIAPGHEGKWKNGRNRCCLKTSRNRNPIATKGRISGPKFCGMKANLD